MAAKTNEFIEGKFNSNRKIFKVDSVLLSEIIEMADKDQNARKSNSVATIENSVKSIDSANTKRIKEIIHKHGWLGYKELGIAGDKKLWLLVQHADHDVTFQKYVLQLIHSAVLANNTDRKHYAYLYDRVCINMKEPQVFGTQFMVNEDGTLVPFPLKDSVNIDYYRAAFGMSKFKAHLEHVNKK